MTDVNQLITEHLDVWTSGIEKKTSTGRANGGRESLYGLKKLRDLILELGVRGRLVPQFDHEGTGEELLTRILQQREALEKNKQVRPKSASSRSSNDWPFSLPDSWTWATLSQASDFRPGKTPSTKNSHYWSSEGQGYPWVSISDLVANGSVASTAKEVSETAHRDVFKGALVPAGTLLMSFKLTIGKTSFLDIDAFHNEAIIGINPLEGVSKDYLFRFLPLLSSFASDKAAIKGNTLNAGSLSLLPVPLPPLAEQHRIVAKVDELMALCDVLERQAEDSLKAHQTLVETCLATLTSSQSPEELAQNWTRIETHFDTLFTTEESLISLWNLVLKLAIRGDLVPQKSSEEPASGCLLGITAAKNIMISEGRLRKTKVLKSIEEDEVPFARPEGWAWSRLNDFIDVRDGTHDSPKDARTGDTFPLITSKNFKNGDIDFDSARRISAEDHHEISKRSRVERDDILFSMIGGNLGNQVIVKTDQEFSVKNVALFKYYDRTKSIPDFVKLYMENLAIDLQSQASGGAQPFVSLGFLRNLLIGVPPVDEQKRIVTKARELERLIEATRDRISSSKTKEIELADTLTSKIH